MMIAFSCGFQGKYVRVCFSVAVVLHAQILKIPLWFWFMLHLWKLGDFDSGQDSGWIAVEDDGYGCQFVVFRVFRCRHAHVDRRGPETQTKRTNNRGNPVRVDGRLVVVQHVGDSSCFFCQHAFRCDTISMRERAREFAVFFTKTTEWNAAIGRQIKTNS